jgi:peptide-methionine (S)-S-oxide reductase
MHSHWPAVRRAILAVFLLAQAAVAQDGAAPATGPGQPDQSGAPQKSSTPKPKARRYDSRRSTAPDSADQASASAALPKTELATFGAGCFWHVEDTFEHQKGVKDAVSGYAGGNIAYPSYEMVHTGETGHAEVVQVEYDPKVITYEDLLNIFWRCHDPTSINRQGEDEGPQYRSVIFYHSEAQRKAAVKAYEQLTRKRVFRAPIVTQLMPMAAFFPAEDYHQNYYSGMRRTTSRRRRPTPKLKQAQTKSKSAVSPAPKPRSTTPSSNDSGAGPEHDNAGTTQKSPSSSDPSRQTPEN